MGGVRGEGEETSIVINLRDFFFFFFFFVIFLVHIWFGLKLTIWA